MYLGFDVTYTQKDGYPNHLYSTGYIYNTGEFDNYIINKNYNIIRLQLISDMDISVRSDEDEDEYNIDIEYMEYVCSLLDTNSNFKHLREISFTDSFDFDIIDKLIIPNTVENITLYNCFNIDKLKLPDKLKKLRIDTNIDYNIVDKNYMKIPILPHLLEELDCYNLLCDIELPPNVKKLSISHMSLDNFSELPESLESIGIFDYIYDSESMFTLTDNIKLPSKLKCLDIQGVNIISFPKLPDSLIHLSLTLCKFDNLPKLPKYLHCLDCRGTSKIILPDELPDTIESLFLEEVGLEKLPDKLPSSLISLIVNRTKLTKLPECISTMEHLEFIYCEKNQITYIPRLPDSLVLLNCNNNKLEHIELPTNKHNLDELHFCDNNITKLPDNIIHCRNLTRIYYEGNEIELTIQEMNFINRMRELYYRYNNGEENVYSDTQNVHNSNIIKCIANNIKILMNDTL